jgi:hypothetical protein
LVIDRFGSQRAREWVRDNQLRGEFDLDVSLSPATGVHRIASDAPSIGVLPMSVYGELLPRSLSLTMHESEADFDSVEGVVRFEGFEGRFDNIRAVGDDSMIAVDGTWSLPPKRGLGMDLRISANGSLLDGPARAVLPTPVVRVIEQLEIKADGGVSIDDMRIVTNGLGTPEGMYDIRGSAKIDQGSALIGLPITGMSGQLGFAVRGSDDRLGYELNLEATRLRAGLLRVFDAKVDIIGDANNPGVILIPEIEFDLDVICEQCIKRSQRGKRFTIIAAAEGAKPKGGEQIVDRVIEHSPEAIRLGGIAKWLADQIEKRTEIESRYVVLGHTQRGGTPVAGDRVLATQFGHHAMELLKMGKQNRLVVMQGGHLSDVDIQSAANKQRLVPKDHALIAAGRSVYTCFGD